MHTKVDEIYLWPLLCIPIPILVKCPALDISFVSIRKRRETDVMLSTTTRGRLSSTSPAEMRLMEESLLQLVSGGGLLVIS